MPTENELKFVLHPIVADTLRERSAKFSKISQGYLLFEEGMSLRLRETTIFADGVRTGRKLEMTLKKHVKLGLDQCRLVEIEQEISFEDFTDLWACCCRRFYKTRYDLSDSGYSPQHGYKWEVDVFGSSTETVLVLAECEMPEGVEQPPSLPPIIEKNLIYAVPRSDNRFASGKLYDAAYAAGIYEEVRREAMRSAGSRP